MIVQIICICIYVFDTFLMYRQSQPDNLASLDLKWKYTCRFPMATLSDSYQSPNEIHTWLCLRDHRFYHHLKNGHQFINLKVLLCLIHSGLSEYRVPPYSVTSHNCPAKTPI